MATLLRAQLNLLGRMAFKDDAIEQVVGSANREAYNLCDGTRTQADVAKAKKLDQGNFSRTVNRWIEAGVLFKIPDGKDAKLQHLFPIPAPATTKAKRKSE
jgi:transcription initiation factor TFIIIB Brf1 subunit/transcription initiation factor TFIIB